MKLLWKILIIVLVYGIKGQNLETLCNTYTITSGYGYNISCLFSISASSSNGIYNVSLMWSIPSSNDFIYNDNYIITGGDNASYVYNNNAKIIEWDRINVSETALFTMYLQPNFSVSSYQMITSIAYVKYYNDPSTSSVQIMRVKLFLYCF